MRNNMEIIITEPCSRFDTKNVGCYFIESAVRKAGYNINYQLWQFAQRKKCDVLLISLHHVSDIYYLKNLKPVDGRIIIAGGHVTNNPYLYLHYVDIICVGEGESWIIKQLQLLNNCTCKDDYIKQALTIPGTLSKSNQHEYITKQYESDISGNPYYLNKSYAPGHLDTWYIEIARGCKSKCNYCELGWTSCYRENSKGQVLSYLDEIGRGNNRRVNIFAPDDFSCSYYNEVLNKIMQLGLVTKFGSMRVDRFKELKLLHKKNFLFRLGVDGLSERIRNIVNKPISNKKIIELFDELIQEGFVRFKFFYVFSYRFEADSDFEEFEWLMNQLKLKAAKLSRPVNLRLKFTPFIPMPLTPMERFYPNYNGKMRYRIEEFFLRQNIERSNIVFENDGIMKEDTYYTQAFFTRCSIADIKKADLEKDWFLPLRQKLIARKGNTKHIKIITRFPQSMRDRVFNNIILKTGLNNENYYDGEI